MTASFDAAALAKLSGIYPNRPGLLHHGLRDHPLLTLEALVALSQRIRPVDAEYNRADLPIGVDPAATPANGLSAADTIRSIERCGSWMVLKFIEQDPAYRALLDEALAPLEPLVGAVTGEMLKTEGFIFISSPGAVTPFHFDPEHNILLQIRGSKTMTVFPAGDEALVGGEQHEAFHQGAHRNLPWKDAFAERGEPFALPPGDAIYVPVKAPHWVKNGPEPSISLSITWRSEWSFHEEYAHGFNRVLRKAGLTPSLPRPFPAKNLAKSVTYRMIQKARRALT
jgi:oxalate decarboxylase/phosphoglucose isomerase-like protein (cupin superfamily)